MKTDFSLGDKIEETEKFLVEHLHSVQQPVLMSSFGKDSMVLLWILKRMDMVPPVLFFEDPWFPHKYSFAHDIIESLGLVVYDYPPIRTSMLYGKNIPAFVNQYHSGANTSIALPKNIVEYQDDWKEESYICGLSFFTRPCGTFQFPWDLVLIGHKSSDSDQIYGKVPLKTRVVHRDLGPNYAFPLIDWDDADIWDYIELFNVPMQTERYNLKKRAEYENKVFNSDYWHACIRCVDERRKGEVVYCPKLETKLHNVSGSVQKFEWTPDYFETDLEVKKNAHCCE